MQKILLKINLKRNGDIIDIRPSVYSHVKSIINHTSNNWIKGFNRGVHWNEEKIDIQGEHWQAAYLPVWLYTYNDFDGEEEILHYIAVNGQTGETMGSVPYSRKTAKLAHTLQVLITIAITIIFPPSIVITIFIFLAFILAFPNSESLYRNEYARHDYEHETPIEILNIKEHDNHIKDLVGINNHFMQDSTHNYQD